MQRTLVIVLALALGALVAAPASARCAPDRVELRGDWGTVRFRVEIADDVRERAQGLMHVEEMARLAGMLFIYERPQRVSFWMENTLIPLDMIFADQNGLVLNVHSNAVPLDRTPIPGGSDEIVYVLEINGGMAEDLGIEAGSEMRHPSVPQETALWPCDD
ncbi:DUF192 domain-containing protein [Rhodobacteraceae bacterium N5(2021)]|uniref:DUF192 domain-containing protein n=1 Tax=Gymnodinialimonas phycosphaerae TaxID=2841589 RepID=A0A975TWM7_9RHOB|nr:DUF192 domain-containing protein [Gymnodinialimonas phycosphaerae]MBY4892322.1 DUF192 domain-containing protein [Gymnodinialimonas phycosphaerae]